MISEAEFYRSVLEQIAGQKGDSLARRLASSALTFRDSMQAYSPTPAKWEKQLKVFVYEESTAHGVQPHTIYQRLYRNRLKYYPNLSLRRVNNRVVFVDTRTI